MYATLMGFQRDLNIIMMVVGQVILQRLVIEVDMLSTNDSC